MKSCFMVFSLALALALGACANNDDEGGEQDGLTEDDGGMQEDSDQPADAGEDAGADENNGECACNTTTNCDPDCECDYHCDPDCPCNIHPACDEGCECDEICAEVCNCNIYAGSCDTGCMCDPDCNALLGPKASDCAQTVSVTPVEIEDWILDSDPIFNSVHYKAYCLSLTAGQTLVAETSEASDGQDLLDDTILRLYSEDGTFLFLDDDDSIGRYSLIEYLIENDGVYVLSVFPPNQLYGVGSNHFRLSLDVQ